MQMSEMGWGRTFCGQPDSGVLAQGQLLLTTITSVSLDRITSPVLPDNPDFQETQNIYCVLCGQIIQKFLNIVQARTGPQTVGGRHCSKEH